MSNLKESQKNPTTWLSDARNAIAMQINKKFCAVDSCGVDVIIEWEYIDAKSQFLSEKIKSLSQLLIDSYAKIELQFAKKYPENVKNEMFLASLEPLLKDGVGNTDWVNVEKQIKAVLKSFFIETDWTKFSNDDDIHLFVIVRESNSEEPLGMAQFLITSEYDYATVKVALYDGVMPLEPHRELNKLLISSIFKILPNIERIFLHTRSTNEEAINTHESFGFRKFSGNLINWTDLEYLTKQSNQLQELSKSLCHE
ncbi:MAG: GNAT family N-acetyltransferase [Neisseriaceae bacterium]